MKNSGKNSGKLGNRAFETFDAAAKMCYDGNKVGYAVFLRVICPIMWTEF